MQTIKIILGENGNIADLQKNFPLYQGQYQSKLLNILVPTSILSPDFVVRAGDSNEIIDEYVAGTAVSVSIRTTERDGKYKQSVSRYVRYLKTLVYQGKEYALFERKLPQEFTFYQGVGSNAPIVIVNVVNLVTNYEYVEDSTVSAITEGFYYTYDENTQLYTQVQLPDDYVEGTTYYEKVLLPSVLQIVTTQTCSLDVLESTDLDHDEPLTPSELETLNAEINEINAILPTKQNINAPTLVTTNKTIVGAINELDTRIDNLPQNENYIGSFTGETQPFSGGTITQAMIDDLNAFVASVKGVDYEKRGGDSVIYTEILPTTDKNYKFIFTKEGTWSGYELPSVETARNGSLGILQGTYGIGADHPVLVDIVNGEINNIYFKENGNYVDLNSIPTTYLTKSAGATKQYVREYALPRQFNDVYYYTSNGLVREAPTGNVQFTATTSLGDTEMFDVSMQVSAEFELSQNNGYSSRIWFIANQDCEVQFRLTTYAKRSNDADWVLLNVELTPNVEFLQGQLSRYDFSHQFTLLYSNVLSMEDGDQLRQVLEIISDTSTPITFQVISGSIQQSTFNLVVTGVKVNSIQIVDNLNSTDPTKALSANMGRVLDNKIKEKVSVEIDDYQTLTFINN